MKPVFLCVLCLLCGQAIAADSIKTKTTYAKAYGETKNPVKVDPAKDLPRYPAVEPKDAISTWNIKKGFHLELAAHEPQVRSPVAASFDESGRMFVCEMIDYSEMREVTPHLGRVSVLEDKDGDGYFETSKVFADDLPWPTGLIYANGGVYVIATPDIWFFKDNDGDGKADVREKVFTGFGTGLKILNVQGLANSPQWGQDNRIHILAGGGNRGVVTCLKRPELKGVELGGKDFWFDPRTHEFGTEGGGAQYGMSFDTYGRKYGCSNSDHLQFWAYDDKYAGRNPAFQLPSAHQSIAADGGAAEVFRISPDEPWRIIRTRWRIAGVVKGAVEGGGRVSGYFTGATGTTIYRGDAYGPDFVNNSFSGDAGGQLVHRKKITPDGVSMVGNRPSDELNFEFTASKDTWVRVVNFANAPDGCMHIIDMYREVIEHPWSIPDEIKQHIDLNNGNDRGRIYRIVPDSFPNRRGTKVDLKNAGTEELVKTLGHTNGWHRDAAQRLLYERNDKAAVPALEKVITGDNALAKLYAMGSLQSFGALSDGLIDAALKDKDEHVRERGLWYADGSNKHQATIATLASDPSPRVRFFAALSLVGAEDAASKAALVSLAVKDSADKWISAAVLTAADSGLFESLRAKLGTLNSAFVENLITIVAASDKSAQVQKSLIDTIASDSPKAARVRALAAGLKRAGTTVEKADADHKLAAVFTKAEATALDNKAAEAARLEAIELLGLAGSKTALETLIQCLGKGQEDAIQSAALTTYAQHSSAAVTQALLANWPNYGAKTKPVALTALASRDDRALAMLDAVTAGTIKATDLSATQVQSLLHHKTAKVADAARKALAAVIPPSREEMVIKYKPALTLKGDAVRGQNVFQSRCMACHRAGTLGLQVGPDLITVKTKGRDGILTAILDPNKEVASQFIAYIVNTRDGQTLSGVIAEDTATSMTLKMMAGVVQTIQRSNIKGSSSTGQSLMPEGIETGMTVQEMADLLDFIESLK